MIDDDQLPQSTLIADNVLIGTQIEKRLCDERIKLFNILVVLGFIVTICLAFALFAIVRVYICYYPTFPDGFWHLPAIIALMISSLLTSMLVLAARFGGKESEVKIKENPVLQEILDTLKNILQRQD